MAKPKKSYTPQPSVTPQALQRMQTILEVLAGRSSVSQAARTLGMSRNHFQTILHRGVSALAEAITPKQGGRPPKPQEVARLQQELESLRRENVQLREQAVTTGRLLQAASGLLQGRIRPVRQARRRREAGGGDEDADGEPRCMRRLREIEEVRQLGFTASMAAAVHGVHASTVRRWKRREGATVSHACAARLVPADAARRAADIVRALKGQVGADSLQQSVPELSRREAARVKARTLTDMERARKRTLARVRIGEPGIVRGMDGMHVHTADGTVHALISADSAVPYRTSLTVGRHYDAELVAEALARDIDANGAPLVYRLDRASAHDAPVVRALLERHQVIVLHGPPHCARFYGQLERQNREHRAWDEELAHLAAEEAERRLREALESLNKLWRRRSLRWQTAAEAWNRRSEPHVDRAALRKEVQQRAVSIERHLQHRGRPADMAQRLAIQQALETRGYLSQTIGGWC